MKRRLTVLALIAALMLTALPAQAYTAIIRTCHGCFTVYDPPGNATCSAGKTWHFRSYTYGFGPADSTGTTTFQYSTGSNAYTKNFSGEHDGVTRTYDSGRGTIAWGSGYYFNMSGVGSGKIDIYCST